MDVEKGSIVKLLNGQFQYIIPVYQRKYSWLPDVQCKRLWDDIVKMVKGHKKHHFVGSIVSIEEKKSLMEVQKQLIIDGQQRMTTLSLLMIALRDYLKENGVGDEVDQSITNLILKNPSRKGDDAYKMLLTDTDKDVMIKLIEGVKINEDEDSLVYTNYLFFKKKVAEGILTPIEIYESIDKLDIVSITLAREQGDEPQLIFESLNSTGMNLSKSDLIRNFVLMGLDNERQIFVYNTYWKPLEGYFANPDVPDRMDRFFRDYLVMRKASYINFDTIYDVFKEQAGKAFTNAEELAEEVMLYGDFYTNITSDKKILPSSQEVLKPIFEEIRCLRMEVAYPFLMKVYMDYIRDIISIEDFVEILRLTIAYVVRRAICDIPTNSMQKTFATMKNSIVKDDYLNSVKASFYYLDSYKQFPNDEKFKDALYNKNMYSLRISKYVYTKLENEGNKEPIPYNGFTTEHILPQNKNMREEWIQALGEDYEDIQTNYVHTLGNLTLTKYNSEMGDKPFEEKKKVYKESVMHNLNKFVVEQDTWNQHTILARTRMLSECACKVWEAPLLDDETKEKYRPKDEPIKQSYDIDSYNMDMFVKMLYLKLKESILEIEPQTRVEYKKLYIAHKLKTNFVDVEPQKARLRLSVNLEFDEVYDPKGICRDVTGLGRWGNGDVEISFESLEMLDSVMEIIKQAIEKQK